MKTFHPLQRPGNLRVFTALLVSLVILVTPVVPLAAGSPRYAASFSPPAATVVSATKTDSWDDTATPDGKAEPGQTITYDVNVANSGAVDATGVNFTDTIDPNTTLVPGSLRVSPLAFADSYSAALNTPLSVPAPGLLANDTGTPAPAAQPIAAGPTTQGGTVTLNADGSFNYTPATGFHGADTFTYTVTNGTTPNDTATVTINVDDGPVVSSVSPVNGASGVAPNSNITVNFSEPVNATTASFSIECPTGTPQTFTLSASPAASFTLDPSADLPGGTTCTVKVIASQVTDADNFDPPDQMAGDYTFSFGVKPLAVDDLNSATGNVRISSSTSVLANDQAPGGSVTAFDATSANGGTVTMNGAGNYTYDPPRGFNGNDSFNYTVTSPAGSDIGTVVVSVTDTVWFVNNAPGACSVGCDGRLTHPYTTLAAFEADNGSGGAGDPKAGDSIFIYGLDGNYTGPVTLENNQIVVGQGAAGAPFGPGSLTGITPAPDSDPLPSTGGTAPVITTTVTSGQPGIALAQNNHLHGLAFSNTDGPAIRGTANVGALLFSEITVNNSGGAGISLTGGGSAASTGVNTITTGTGTALNVVNTDIAAAGMTFRSVSANGAANGIVLRNTGSTGSLTVTGNGGTCTIATPTCTGGTIQNTVSDGIVLENTKDPSFSFVNVKETGRQGIWGKTVNGFTLKNSLNLGAGDGDEENGILFEADATTTASAAVGTAINGTILIQDVVIDAPQQWGFRAHASSGSANVTLRRVTVQNNYPGTFGEEAVSISNEGTASSNVLVDACNFLNVNAGLRGNAQGTGGAVLNMTVQDSVVNQSQAVPFGINFTTSGSATGRVKATNNTFIGCSGSGAGQVPTTQCGIGLGFDSTGTSHLDAVVQNNTISDTGTGGGIQFIANNNSVGRADISGNTITPTPGRLGMNFQARTVLPDTGDTGELHLTLTNNTLNNVNTALLPGFAFQAGSSGSTPVHKNLLCVNIDTPGAGANTVNGTSGTDVYAYTLRQRANTTFQIQGLTGLGTDKNNVESYIDANHGGGTLAKSVGGDSGITSWTDVFAPSGSGSGATINNYTAGTCQTPTAPTAPPLVSAYRSGDASGDVAASAATVEPHVWSDMPASSESAARQGAATQQDAVYVGVLGTSAREAQTIKASYEPSRGHNGRRVTERAKRSNAYAPSAPASLFSGETVNASVGTLPAGKTVHITFQVTVADPFTGAQPQVSNQGTVSGDNFTTVQTDDPAAGGSADATVTPILTPPSVSVKDATVAEPASGSAPAAFAVTLSHSYTHVVTVNYSTADDTATQPGDYTTTSGTLTFSPGQTVQTVSVPVNADANAEANETFFVNLSGATGGATIADAQAVGTITPESTPGTVVISEVRTSGPGGADDDFVELYNNTDAPVTVAASDASGGWALVKSAGTCGDTPVVVAVIPNGTVIPARGNYLLVGTGYSLGAYAAGDQTLVFNVEDDRNVALFNTADLSNISTAARLDAVGFGPNSGGNCDLLREGSTLQPAAGSAAEYSFVRSVDKGATKDTNDNASDFIVVSTTGGAVGSNASSTLGAPGPENSTGARGPVPCNVTDTAKFGRARLDSAAALGSAPNTARDATVVPNGANGTIDFRRTFTNNTGGNVTRLRFRITNVKDTSTPGTADLRALTSSDIVVTTSGGPVTVRGTTLEQPPAQANGGSVNSSLGVGSITLGTPLAPGASVNLHLLFGVQAAGDYHVSFVVETATAGSIGQDVWELRGNTETASASEGGCNTPPTANAGADQTIECGGGTTSVTLDGTASTDADGDALTYEWREGATVLGTGATLNTSLSFGPHTITLKVTDPSGDFGEDTVSVNVVDTTDPSITAPGNVSVNTGPGASSCGAFVSDATLGTASASDGCSASVTVTRTGVPSGNNFPVGTTIVTYTADDGHGHTAKAYQSVTVTDNTPPVITTPANIVTNAPPNSCSANVNPGTATATDNCSGVTVTGTRSDSQPLNAPYPVGTTTITWKATDASNNTATGTQTVTVKDATPPTITLTTNAISLGSPNHQYQTLSIAQLVASAGDSCDPSVDINDVVISQVTSDELDDAPGGGDGNTSNDMVIAPDCKSLQLRAERQGGGDGRVYHITLKVKDSSGNVATAVRTIVVPQSGPAVDSGVNNTVNGCAP